MRMPFISSLERVSWDSGAIPETILKSGDSRELGPWTTQLTGTNTKELDHV